MRVPDLEYLHAHEIREQRLVGDAKADGRRPPRPRPRIGIDALARLFDPLFDRPDSFALPNDVQQLFQLRTQSVHRHAPRGSTRFLLLGVEPVVVAHVAKLGIGGAVSKGGEYLNPRPPIPDAGTRLSAQDRNPWTA